MAGLLARLNNDMNALVAGVQRSLVVVENGHGAGAGTVWHADGLVVTNAHVVGRNPRPWVVLPDGTRARGEVLALSDDLDLAALAVDAHDLPTATLGDSRALRPGEWVLALGHPFGVKGAATAGVVIGVGANLPERPAHGSDWLALSLHLRPGHSGGPVVDAAGALVGINTIMAGPDVGIAVPVHVAKAFLQRAWRLAA